MEETASREPNIRSASQAIFRLLRNLEVHYCVPKSPQLVPIISQTNQVQTSTLFP
jgi:hypothetical protein